jgi:hypothetical protein
MEKRANEVGKREPKLGRIIAGFKVESVLFILVSVAGLVDASQSALVTICHHREKSAGESPSQSNGTPDKLKSGLKRTYVGKRIRIIETSYCSLLSWRGNR